MKKTLTATSLLLIFSCFSTQAKQAPSPKRQFSAPQGFTYGVGVAVKREIYKGYKQRVVPLPLFGYQGDKLSVYGPFISYKLYQHNQVKVSALVAPRFEGFDESDSDYFEGMEERKFSMDAGLGVDYKPKGWHLSAKLRADVLSRSNGYEANFKVAKSYRYGPISFGPDIGLTYLDSHNVDYYYGVRASEATADRAFYQGQSALNKSVGFSASSPMYGGFVRAGINHTWYDDAITDSPLTERDASLSFMLTYSRFFN
ncbi:MipA/OmpV family protein [Catenovulum adriaticum]|uniref:MipA/OmpV family protein n=1 Tax=Catenovulum adriaticum TaxID=2984846 RepID=A0ABY7ARD1_9ALTE|nr:MipA/OmpV family protein [Catenovulum sp. TS8]WAJ70811.1 MipA/OmpV family protein [Catenovulum sp. TS8]